MNYPRLVTIFVYIVAFLVIIYALKMENLDLNCPSVQKGRRVCGPGQGMAYVNGKPKETDNIVTLLNKIEHSGKYENNSVKWRRALIFAVIMTLIIFGFLHGGLPTGQEFLIVTLILYIGIYFIFLYYERKLAHPANKQIHQAVTLIKDKLDIY